MNSKDTSLYKNFKENYVENNQDKRFVGNNSAFIGDNVLLFDAIYEGGNLDCAVQVGEFEYDLFLRVDSNTKGIIIFNTPLGHLSWFNFKVKNLQKDIPYKFNICNMTKKKCLYERGMSPYIYSKRLKMFKGISWQ